MRKCQPLLLDDYITGEMRAYIDIWDREYPPQEDINERHRQAQDERETIDSCLALRLTEEEGKRYSAHAGGFYQSPFAWEAHDAKIAAYIQADISFRQVTQSPKGDELVPDSEESRREAA